MKKLLFIAFSILIPSVSWSTGNMSINQGGSGGLVIQGGGSSGSGSSTTTLISSGVALTDSPTWTGVHDWSNSNYSSFTALSVGTNLKLPYIPSVPEYGSSYVGYPILFSSGGYVVSNSSFNFFTNPNTPSQHTIVITGSPDLAIYDDLLDITGSSSAGGEMYATQVRMTADNNATAPVGLAAYATMPSGGTTEGSGVISQCFSNSGNNCRGIYATSTGGGTNVGASLTASGGTKNNALLIGGGSINLNGSSGSSGQVLTSGGDGVIPSWTSPISIGSAISSGVAGSVLYVDSNTALNESTTNFFWDNTNARLGIGTNAPGKQLEIQAPGYYGTNWFQFEPGNMSGPRINILYGGVVLSSITVDSDGVLDFLHYSGYLKAKGLKTEGGAVVAAGLGSVTTLDITPPAGSVYIAGDDGHPSYIEWSEVGQAHRGIWGYLAGQSDFIFFQGGGDAIPSGTEVLRFKPSGVYISTSSYLEVASTFTVSYATTTFNGVQMSWPSSGTVGGYLQYYSSNSLQWVPVTAGGGTWGTITGSVPSQTDLWNILSAVGTSTQTLSNSTVTINGILQTLGSSTNTLATSTGVLQGEVQTLGTSTNTQNGILQTLGTSTNTQNGILQTLGTSTNTHNGILQTLGSSTNTLSASTITLQGEVQTLGSSTNTLSISTANIVSSMSATYMQFAGTESISGAKTWQSRQTFNGALYVSTSISMGGTVGTLGQVLISNGAGQAVGWSNVSAATGYDVRPSTIDFQLTRGLTIGSMTFTSMSAPTTPNAGTVWYDSTYNSLISSISAVLQNVPSTLFTIKAASAIANVNTAQTMLDPNKVAGSLTLPANFFTVGKTIYFVMHGTFTQTGTPTIAASITLGGTTILSTGPTTMGTYTQTVGSRTWTLDGEITCYATGATATMMGNATLIFNESASVSTRLGLTTTAQTINTANAQAIQLNITWGTANANNAFTITSGHASVFY